MSNLPDGWQYIQSNYNKNFPNARPKDIFGRDMKVIDGEWQAEFQ